MTRRKLLSLLAGLPLMGRFAPKAESAPVMQHVLKPCGYHVSAFLVDRDGNRHRDPLFAWYEQECAGYLQDMKDRLAIMAAPRPRRISEDLKPLQVKP
jgi:hypothetical protein